MANPVVMPKLGQTVEQATIVKWHKQVGDKVRKGDVLFEIETDKAVLEAESFFDGELLKIFAPEGREVPVLSVVAYIGEPGETCPDAPPPPPETPAQALPEKPQAPSAPAKPPSGTASGNPAAERSAAPSPEPPPPASPAPPPVPERPRRLKISPRARALARDRAIDPSPVSGSGPGGRIVEKDVRDYLENQGYDRLRVTPAALAKAREHEVDLLSVRPGGQGGRILVEDVERRLRCKPVPMSRMRQTIARRLSESFGTVPHFYVSVTVDLTELLRFRQALKADGKRYTVNDFILQSTVLALEGFPVVNSSTDGRSVAWRGDVDLGVAVSVENGLVVPVVRAAQTLTFGELAERARALAEKARAGQLTPDEMSGGSLTISNMGMLDVDQFNAIINPGESAILAVATAREEPAVVNGEIAIRTRMRLTLSADHRLVDGATGAAFVNAVKNNLEDLSLWKSLTLS